MQHKSTTLEQHRLPKLQGSKSFAHVRTISLLDRYEPISQLFF